MRCGRLFYLPVLYLIGLGVTFVMKGDHSQADLDLCGGTLHLCILALLFLLFRPRTTASLLPSHGGGLTYGEVIRTAKGLRSESLICTPAQLGTWKTGLPTARCAGPRPTADSSSPVAEAPAIR